MYKILSIVASSFLVISLAECVQNNCADNGSYERKMMQEQQQLLRREVENQEEMLRVQQKNIRNQKYGW